MAEAALKHGEGNLDTAIAEYRASIGPDTPPAEAIDVLGRLLRLLGVERGQTEKAEAVEAELAGRNKQSRLDEAAREAYRRALIASGDARL